jgi:exopolysaccharide biosynthesis polyprenyl glycosylphosphotransferase
MLDTEQLQLILSRETRAARPKLRLSLPRAKTILALADAGSVLVAAALCLWLIPVDAGRFSTVPVLACAPAVWVLALSRQHAYTARRISRRLEETRRLVHASWTALATIVLLAAATNIDMPRRSLVILPALATLFLLIERELARRAFLRMRRSGVLQRPVIVVGANQEAIDLANAVALDRGIGYSIVGFVTDMPIEVISDSIRTAILGEVKDVPKLVQETGAVGVVIASTAVTTAVSNRLARTLTDAGVHVEITSTLRDISLERLTIGNLGRFPTVYVDAVRRGGWRARTKRAFDLVSAAVLGVLLAPILLIVALLVKLTSPGPALFRQRRVGQDGKTFELIKFRTMVADADAQLEAVIDLNEASGPLFKISNDPRVTTFGRFLRRTSLDEVPQLWNVLRGDMSLVGPRPALPEEAASWVPEVHERLRVKPGITGMWQVNGRSLASFDDYVRLDLYYVDNWSLLTDLAIVCRTVPTVLLRRGAY